MLPPPTLLPYIDGLSFSYGFLFGVMITLVTGGAIAAVWLVKAVRNG